MDQQTQQLLDQMKEQGLKDLSTLAKNQVAIALMPAAQMASKKLKDVIPGTWDDAFIDTIVAKAIPMLRDELMNQLDKLSQPTPVQPAVEAPKA